MQSETKILASSRSTLLSLVTKFARSCRRQCNREQKPTLFRPTDCSALSHYYRSARERMGAFLYDLSGVLGQSVPFRAYSRRRKREAFSNGTAAALRTRGTWRKLTLRIRGRPHGESYTIEILQQFSSEAVSRRRGSLTQKSSEISPFFFFFWHDFCWVCVYLSRPWGPFFFSSGTARSFIFLQKLVVVFGRGLTLLDAFTAGKPVLRAALVFSKIGCFWERSNTP